MPATVVGTLQRSSAASPGASYSPSNWQTPQGSTVLLMLVWAASGSPTTVPTITLPTIAGNTFTARGGQQSVNGTSSDTRLAVFSINATNGTETVAPSIALGNMAGAGATVNVLCIELAGQMAAPFDGVSSYGTSTSVVDPVSVTSGTVVTSVTPDYLISFAGVYGVTGTGTPTFAWSGTPTFASLQNFAYAGNMALSVGTVSTTATGTYSSSVSITSNAAGTGAFVITIAIKVANVVLGAAMASSSVMSTAMIEQYALTAAMASASSFSASGTETQAATASMASASAFSASGTETVALTASMFSASSFSTSATETVALGASMASASLFAGSVTESVALTAPMASASSFASTATETQALTASMASASSMSADGAITVGLSADMASASSISSSASVSLPLTAVMVSVSAFSASGTGTVSFTAVMASASAMSAGETVSHTLTAAMLSASSMSASGTHAVPFSTTMVSASSFTGTFPAPVRPVALDLVFESELPSWAIITQNGVWLVEPEQNSWSLVVEGDSVEVQQILQVEYTNPVLITNRNGVDLSLTSVSIAISQNYDDTPDDDAYAGATVLDRSADYIRAQLLVDRSQFTDGVYYEWVKIDSNPEIIPQRVATLVVGPRP